MTMATLAWVAETAGGELLGADVGFDSVSTDTRSIEAGQLFVALRGSRHDATAFIAEAAARGAVAAIVEQNQSIALPQVVVPNAGKALQEVAAAWRQRFAIPVLGVTGSNGKTTLKEMMGAIMRAQVRESARSEIDSATRSMSLAGEQPEDDGDVLVTWGNLNNHVGVPITLLWLRDAHRAAVIEMGASARGEIALLTKIARPTVAVITNAGPAHLAGFGGTVRDVAESKGELFEGLAADAVAVVNRDDAFYDYWRGLRPDVQYRSFGLGATADYRARDIALSNGGSPNGEGLSFRLVSPSGEVDIRLPMAGSHNISNALAAAAATTAAGATLTAVRDGLNSMQNVKGRLRPEPGPRGSVLYDDTYNANPGSVSAAITFLKTLAGERWFVLGDMAELGPTEIELHRQIGRQVAESGIERFYCVGGLARHAAEAFGPEAQWAPDVAALTELIRPALSSSIRLLVKGSRSAGLDRLVRALAEQSEEASEQVPGRGARH